MTTLGDKVLEFLVLGGLLLITGLLMFFVVPEGNAQLFSSALTVLTVIATLVAKSLWERGSAMAQDTAARQANLGAMIDKLPIPIPTTISPEPLL